VALLAAPPPPPQAVTPAAIASAGPMLARPGHPISRLQSVMACTHQQQEQPAAYAEPPSVAGRYPRAPATTSLIQDQARPPRQWARWPRGMLWSAVIPPSGLLSAPVPYGTSASGPWHRRCGGSGRLPSRRPPVVPTPGWRFRGRLVW